MATVKGIYQILDEFAPFSTQMGFDNAGLLVGREEAEVTRILVSLDVTLPVVREAVRVGAQLIVAHHPVIFHPVKSICGGDPTGEVLMALIENKIAAICAHTNLDVAVGGVNDALARKLGLRDIQVFLSNGEDGRGRPFGLGRIGVTEKNFTPAEFAEKVKSDLGANGVRFVDTGRPVRKVAVGGGACADELYEAVRQGCDAFVTADVKYNFFLDAQALGLALMDAGHFPTENVVLPVVKRLLEKGCPNVEILLTQTHSEVFSCL